MPLQRTPLRKRNNNPRVKGPELILYKRKKIISAVIAGMLLRKIELYIKYL